MRSEHVRSGDVRRLEQRMKIGDEVACRARHGDGRAPTQMMRIEKRSRPIIRADPGEPGDLRKHSTHSSLKWGAPDFGIIPVPGLQNHCRTAGATALEIHFASTAGINETGKITRD